MKKQFRILCLVTLVLMAFILPVAAAPFPTVTDSGVSKFDVVNIVKLEDKSVWTKSEGTEAMSVWMRIPIGSDAAWDKAGCTNSLTPGCTGHIQYFAQWRFITPDGKEWLPLYKNGIFGEWTETDQGRLFLHTGKFFRSAAGKSNANEGDEYGGPYYWVSDLISSQYEWRGQWKAELYILNTDVNPRKSTLVATKYFTLKDDVPVITTTTPITPSPAQKIIIEGEKYIDASVQKTGAEWDSNEEKCPTWRGNDWSGTGDYYLSHGGDTLTYLITAPATGNYVMWLRDWSDTNHAAGDRQVTVTIDGATIGTFDAASSFNKGTTGYGWDKFTTVNLGAGSHTVKIIKKETTSSAAIIDELWFSSNVNEIPQGYAAHSEELCAPTPTHKIIVEAEKYIDASVQKTGAEWDSNEEKCPTWRGNDWSGTGDYYLSHGGDTLTYLITAPVTGNYVMWLRDCSDTNHAAGDRQVTVTIDGATLGTFDAASSFNKGTTGYGWDKFTTVNLGAGSHTVKIIKKETTSSAAVIDVLWFSSNVNEIPQGYITHSNELCAVTSVTTTPIIYCTAPPCSSGKFVCLLNNGCPGGCGMSCENPITPVISVTTTPTPTPSPTPTSLETAVLLLAIGIAVAVIAKRRD